MILGTFLVQELTFFIAMKIGCFVLLKNKQKCWELFHSENLEAVLPIINNLHAKSYHY